MFNYKDKTYNIQMLNKYMLDRTLSMFNYKGLPDTIPKLELEKQLQHNGYTFITRAKDNNLYAFDGNFSGERDAYGRSTKIIINNPYLPYHETLDIENDGVLIYNDDMRMGLTHLIEKYNTLLTENEISMFIHMYNTRIQTLISAADDQTRESAENYVNKIIEGELSVIGENRIFEGIEVNDQTQKAGGTATELTEFHQYIKASLFNELGIQANFNMKRERLNQSEVEMNEDNIKPLIHNMFKTRKEGIKKLNSMFNRRISVDFGSVWKEREEETMQNNRQNETGNPNEVRDEQDREELKQQIRAEILEEQRQEQEDEEERRA